MGKRLPVPPVPLPPGRRPRHMGERTPEERRALGRQGGKAAQAAGKVGPKWTLEQAREMGRKGGRARRKARGTTP